MATVAEILALRDKIKTKKAEIATLKTQQETAMAALQQQLRVLKYDYTLKRTELIGTLPDLEKE